MNMNMNTEIFGRVTAEGNVAILVAETGEAVTRLDANVYPIGSDLSARYEHPAGIVLSADDAAKLGVVVE